MAGGAPFAAVGTSLVGTRPRISSRLTTAAGAGGTSASFGASLGTAFAEGLARCSLTRWTTLAAGAAFGARLEDQLTYESSLPPESSAAATPPSSKKTATRPSRRTRARRITERLELCCEIRARGALETAHGADGQMLVGAHGLLAREEPANFAIQEIVRVE